MKPGNPRARAPSKDWTGQTLYGKWTVERLIGAGGTATVLQARHRNGRRAALKILHPHLAAHGRMQERFLREGRLANLVNHPGVVAVLDDFMTDDGTAVLVLELVQGKTLATLAKESGGFLEPREVVDAARLVLEILAVAHDANVVHRDIKPENILRCENGSYKLADFGLAALCHELGMLTGTNASLGTPAYMSPEQARGDTRQVDARADIWGLGATMFTLLTGRYLHAASPPRNLVVASATEPVPPVLSLEPGMHPPIAEVIDRAVRMNKEERWPNARAMLAALEVIEVPAHSDVRRIQTAPANDEGGVSTAASSLMSWSHATAWLRRRELRSRRLVGALLGAVVLVVAIAASLPRGSAVSSTPAGTAVESKPEPQPARVAAPIPPPKPDAPVTRAREMTTAERHDAPPAPKQAAARAHGSPKPASRPTTSVPPASVPIGAPDLSVPDEVLDRRE